MRLVTYTAVFLGVYVFGMAMTVLTALPQLVSLTHAALIGAVVSLGTASYARDERRVAHVVGSVHGTGLGPLPWIIDGAMRLANDYGVGIIRFGTMSRLFAIGTMLVGFFLALSWSRVVSRIPYSPVSSGMHTVTLDLP